VLLGFMGLVADVGWLQIGIVRAQRAADAAALAGAPYLPGNVPGAITAARAEATANGFTDGTNGATVTVAQDAVNPDLLNVTVSAPVRTFMSRLFGVNTFPTTRSARAEFILPVPMGSPLSYYGVYQLCDQSGVCSAINDPNNVPLPSQGFWGSVITYGGNRTNGDLYSTRYNGNPTQNTYYDPNGYNYQIDFPAGSTNGRVYIFDPSYCATGKLSGAQLGTGDHWIGGGAKAVTTQFTLWDMRGTPYDLTDDTVVATDGGLFTNQLQVDKGAYAGDSNYGGGVTSGVGITDCQSDPYHNKWWLMASGIVPGQYRLQVQTSSANNATTNAENMFSIMATVASGPSPHVYGQARMCSYMNLVGGSQVFYLAQIAAVHAGKTLQITAFDPGDVGGNAYLKFRQPTSAGYVDATFNWTASNGLSGTNATSLQVASGGTNLFDNQFVYITIPLASTYNAPTPPGEPGPGWWKVEYDVGGIGNDTVTWAVAIRGNPVHLIVP
jgi:hypothetical protein